MTSQIRPVLVLFAFLTLMTGVVYPFVVTGIGTALFPDAARGSLIVRDGQPIGSRLIGRSFTEPKYFWGRPSATATAPYNALASGGSNQGPLNPALEEAVRGRIEALRTADPGNGALIPVDLITASASGLDPHISVAAAQYQVARVANARGLPATQVGELVVGHTSERWLGLFGEPTVNVLALNLALDDIAGRVGE
ncbi:K+-transporting ATPase ATPase C chain [Povalibacter uvarum]|uniref:Potassium-transporting ATPase KdpC subunit n=1 Tax=Povalibacter uvarum TaxID=732238 RepID=A0A841HM02_9GAMM|nr:potassium-transporting ATPase subunit KdpC [Povalibacter uvarum]MBB6094107.1 K+-transporting ATPase ATPase C chain [Povalibacter uvarum]